MTAFLRFVFRSCLPCLQTPALIARFCLFGLFVRLSCLHDVRAFWHTLSSICIHHTRDLGSIMPFPVYTSLGFFVSFPPPSSRLSLSGTRLRCVLYYFPVLTLILSASIGRFSSSLSDSSRLGRPRIPVPPTHHPTDPPDSPPFSEFPSPPSPSPSAYTIQIQIQTQI
ncbi:hypothetical protein C8Q76DRAFT_467116 [Earliella scabrosa]|nr:hypothetical protein C8Q76DRAFT_467116 [Earliella scabrosa]